MSQGFQIVGGAWSCYWPYSVVFVVVVVVCLEGFLSEGSAAKNLWEADIQFIRASQEWQTQQKELVAEDVQMHRHNKRLDDQEIIRQFRR